MNMVRPEIRKSALTLAVASARAFGVSEAQASGFALMEQNASGLGNAFAGQAAVAEDASTIFFNAAGLSLLPKGANLALGGDYIDLSTKFSNSGSVPATGRPLGTDGGNAGRSALIPSIYFAMDVAPKVKIGVGVNAPFGLKTEYDAGWIGRFQAIKSSVETLNVNPTVAYQVNDKLSLGAGLNYQTLKAELTKAVSLGVAEGTAKVSGDDSGWGYNLGVMYQFTPATRLGVSYRSPIKYKIEGDATFSPGVPAPSGAATLDLKVPDTFSLALSQQLAPNLTLLLDATRTGWSSIKELKVINVASGATLDTTPENFKNTWRYGVGATYRYSNAWSLKAGIALDKTPVNDTDRTPRLPDQDRKWLSFGAQYRVSNTAQLDIGYAHLFIKDTSINQNAGNTARNALISGTYEASINIFGVQYSQTF
jgi:long-chain fatty acid transport protein